MVSADRYRNIKIYIEGGGEQRRLKTECRRSFAVFFQKAGFKGRMPRLVACGSRNEAYQDFRSSIKNARRTNEFAFLLVDSEGAVREDFQNRPWEYFENAADIGKRMLVLAGVTILPKAQREHNNCNKKGSKKEEIFK